MSRSTACCGKPEDEVFVNEQFYGDIVFILDCETANAVKD